MCPAISKESGTSFRYEFWFTAPTQVELSQAVSSCASDATYHVMWIIFFIALDDYGVKELNEVTRMGSPITTVANFNEIDTLVRKIAHEALNGALRIAGLVRALTYAFGFGLITLAQAGVLTSNGYLVGLTFVWSATSKLTIGKKLDPAVMHVSCIQAGSLLARLGRPEVINCIQGLEQYSQSYEEAGESAIDMRRRFELARNGDSDFNYMAAVAPRQEANFATTQADRPMIVDEVALHSVHSDRVGIPIL